MRKNWVVGLAAMMMPAVTWADEVNLYVKIGCHPESKSVSIHVFTDGSEAGKALLLKHPNSDIYSVLDDKIRTCDLGDKQEVQVGPSYTLPIGNAQHIYIRAATNMGIRGLRVPYYLDYTDWDLDIQPSKDGTFAVRYCASTDTNFKPEIKKQFKAPFKEHKTVCETVEAEHTAYTVEGVLY